MRPCDNELSNTALYENVNFFDNDFSEDVGDILLGLKDSADDINYWSPDNTTNGNLKKCWRIIDGKRVFSSRALIRFNNSRSMRSSPQG